MDEQPKSKITKSEEGWKKKLSSEQYSVLRQCGTEPAFTGKLLYNKKSGMYVCAACGNKLFSSNKKYDSGTGWPSFWNTEEKAVRIKPDRSHGMVRDEVICAKCGGHLGHLFNDGPKPTGKRFCINSAALEFEGRGEERKK